MLLVNCTIILAIYSAWTIDVMYNVLRYFVSIVFTLLPMQSIVAWPLKMTLPHPKAGGGVSTQCEDLSAEPIRYGLTYDEPGSGLPDTVQDIHDVWLAGGCVGCHNSSAMGGLRLDQPGFAGLALVMQPSSRNPDLIRVFPTRPEESLLYAMINCVPPVSYPIMPPPIDMGSMRINRALRAMVYDWIEQGARGVDEDGNPISEIIFRDAYETQRFQGNLVAPSQFK